MFKKLKFRPFPGTSSFHLQMILSQFALNGKAPASETVSIDLKDGDKLACEISCHESIDVNTPTVVLVHGLGGSSQSGYLIRLSRKFHIRGYRTVRVNLRGSLSGMGVSSRPYNAGTSDDLFEVLKYVKQQYPDSPLILIGFSLGGNISIKLAGELGEQAQNYIDYMITVGTTIDLYHSIECISKISNWLYHRYYLWYLLQQSEEWLPKEPICSLYEFDDLVTAPHWGYRNAMHYYETCSSCHYMNKVLVPARFLFAEDDPFIDYELLLNIKIPANVSVYLTEKGGHMGYFGWAGKEHGFNWLDRLLLEWVQEIYPVRSKNAY